MRLSTRALSRSSLRTAKNLSHAACARIVVSREAVLSVALKAWRAAAPVAAEEEAALEPAKADDDEMEDLDSPRRGLRVRVREASTVLRFFGVGGARKGLPAGRRPGNCARSYSTTESSVSARWGRESREERTLASRSTTSLALRVSVRLDVGVET